MKHLTKKGISIMLAILLVVGLTACSTKVGNIELEEGKNAIYIEEDGTVFYGVAEKFAEEYYDAEELEEEINKEIENYNNSSKASVSEAVSIDKFDVDDKTAFLILKFATVYDFDVYTKGYNNETKSQFFAGSIKENKDCKIQGDFITTDKSKTVTEKEIKNMKDANILIVNNIYQVQIESDIKFISTNCSINQDGIVTTGKSEDGLSYIVY